MIIILSYCIGKLLIWVDGLAGLDSERILLWKGLLTNLVASLESAANPNQQLTSSW